MSQRRAFVALLALGPLALGPPAASAQVRTRAQTMTRLVKLFLGLETELIDAQRSGNTAALGRLLGDDFEQRSTATPGAPLPRAEWLAAAPGQWPGETWIEQMAVHDRGDTAIVSFLARPAAAGPVFIVDVWIRAGATWQLSVRYASPT